jgi:hypothetical protein
MGLTFTGTKFRIFEILLNRIEPRVESAFVRDLLHMVNFQKTSGSGNRPPTPRWDASVHTHSRARH